MQKRKNNRRRRIKKLIQRKSKRNNQINSNNLNKVRNKIRCKIIMKRKCYNLIINTSKERKIGLIDGRNEKLGERIGKCKWSS